MTGAAILLFGLASRTPVMFADGLRYVGQAQVLDRGSWKEGLAHAVDHPAYPIAICFMHHVLGGELPEDWQTAAQIAAAGAGVALVVPIYLLASELYGAELAWLVCLLTYMVPLTGHVLADALAESTFLLFWTCACWTALRFLRGGALRWLSPTIVLAGLAYLTRPEGILLPIALVGLLGIMLILPALRLGRREWTRSVLLLVVGPLLIAGPYITLKGGIGTKPAVSRLLGLSGQAHEMAIERERPLDPEQSAGTTYLLAARAAVRAVSGAVSAPLMGLAAVSLLTLPADPVKKRQALFMGLIAGGWFLALIRLHATAGYCTPRHALILALPMIAASAQGIKLLADGTAGRLKLFSGLLRPEHSRTLLIWSFLILALLVRGRELVAPINQGFLGYRQAGEWLRERVPGDARVLDLKGWARFYGNRPGYSFDGLAQFERDRNVGWVVAHDALMTGPWFYCEILRRVVDGRAPVASFPVNRQPGVAQVHIYDLSKSLARDDRGTTRGKLR
jgi:hypothetical protein